MIETLPPPGREASTEYFGNDQQNLGSHRAFMIVRNALDTQVQRIYSVEYAIPPRRSGM